MLLSAIFDINAGAGEQRQLTTLPTEIMTAHFHKKLEQKPATADPNPSISERPKENLLKRHSYLVPLVTLLLGSGLLAFFKNGLIDGRIRETLRDPLQKIADQGEKIAEINGKLSGIADLLKIVVQNEMKRVSALTPLDFDKRSLNSGAQQSALLACDGAKTLSATVGRFCDSARDRKSTRLNSSHLG